eukprot:GHVL01039296.1.p1 GENE.GHVL01039296.1~~GHVL01039296.1.p1  ORF type:complete len:329 (+),score=44.71 GHVL01039296.1:97-1083(+)
MKKNKKRGRPRTVTRPPTDDKKSESSPPIPIAPACQQTVVNIEDNTNIFSTYQIRLIKVQLDSLIQLIVQVGIHTSQKRDHSHFWNTLYNEVCSMLNRLMTCRNIYVDHIFDRLPTQNIELGERSRLCLLDVPALSKIEEIHDFIKDSNGYCVSDWLKNNLGGYIDTGLFVTDFTHSTQSFGCDELGREFCGAEDNLLGMALHNHGAWNMKLINCEYFPQYSESVLNQRFIDSSNGMQKANFLNDFRIQRAKEFLTIEDRMLLEGVKIFGVSSWTLLARLLPSRDPETLYRRYLALTVKKSMASRQGSVGCICVYSFKTIYIYIYILK